LETWDFKTTHDIFDVRIWAGAAELKWWVDIYIMADIYF
jgi:hypothetical protein